MKIFESLYVLRTVSRFFNKGYCLWLAVVVLAMLLVNPVGVLYILEIMFFLNVLGKLWGKT